MSEIQGKRPASILPGRSAVVAGVGPGHRPGRALRNVISGLAASLILALLQFAPGMIGTASAATPLNVFVGYMDTHSVPSSAKQPTPWPYTDPSSFDGSPCPNFPKDTTCWDASAIRLDNPGSTDVTGVHPVVKIGTRVYDLWGSNVTVKAHGTMVLTETGQQNSTNFDGSDYPPNAYNGGNTASCANSGAIPAVSLTIGGVMTTYMDSGQVLNGGGVDSGHCLNGAFVSGRMDESHPWVQIGSSAPTAPTAPQSLAATAGSGSVSLTWAAPASDGGAAITGYNIYRGTSPGSESATPIAANVSAAGFTDSGLVNGTTYYYKVAAVNASGTSAMSNEASAKPAAVNVTSSVKISQTAFTYSKPAKAYVSTVTVQNVTTQSIAGPLELVLTNLAAGVTVVNASGTSGGSPYVTITTSSLGAGKSVAVKVQVQATSAGQITYTPVVYSGRL